MYDGNVTAPTAGLAGGGLLAATGTGSMMVFAALALVVVAAGTALVLRSRLIKARTR
ncbi:hypothetical protein ACTVZO_44085 [Streptomyces sp. IBSNAI002]|uniref:hypothetical protein n=1 Tax=Streptomyces sp. IBSNAI002 TaxID=3457500 RepID=UPI003FD45996